MVCVGSLWNVINGVTYIFVVLYVVIYSYDTVSMYCTYERRKDSRVLITFLEIPGTIWRNSRNFCSGVKPFPTDVIHFVIVGLCTRTYRICRFRGDFLAGVDGSGFSLDRKDGTWFEEMRRCCVRTSEPLKVLKTLKVCTLLWPVLLVINVSSLLPSINRVTTVPPMLFVTIPTFSPFP